MMRDYFLKTKRIGFSLWSGDDLTLADSLWGDEKVTHFICANGTFSPQEIQERLALEIRQYEKYGVQYFPIFHLEKEEFIGCCGMRPNNGKTKSLELGFHLRQAYWKKGLAFEAANAMIQYSFTVLQVDELKAGHHPQNIASQMLLQKLGFQYEKDSYYEPTGLFHPSYYLINNRQIQV